MATMFVFILVVQWWVNSYAMIYEKFKINESSVCLMLQIDTHMKKNINTQTHEDSHFLFSQSLSNEPQTHLVQSSQANTHTCTHIHSSWYRERTTWCEVKSICMCWWHEGYRGGFMTAGMSVWISKWTLGWVMPFPPTKQVQWGALEQYL